MSANEACTATSVCLTACFTSPSLLFPFHFPLHLLWFWYWHWNARQPFLSSIETQDASIVDGPLDVLAPTLLKIHRL